MISSNPIIEITELNSTQPYLDKKKRGRPKKTTKDIKEKKENRFLRIHVVLWKSSPIPPFIGT